MKNKLLFYGIGLCIGLYIAAAMFPSRLADINVAIPDGYILSIFGSKLYNVPMYLSIMMDLVSDTDLDKATRLFFLKKYCALYSNNHLTSCCYVLGVYQS